MKIYAINGGPRKTWNTAAMLKSFLVGAQTAESNVETETIHLFDLAYKGCRSCYGCKRKGKSYGTCGIKDDLHALLPAISEADGIVMGSPVYYYNMTGELRSFLERLLFPYDSFEQGESTLAPRPLETALLYTMNVTEERMRQSGYDRNLAGIERTIGTLFSSIP